MKDITELIRNEISVSSKDAVFWDEVLDKVILFKDNEVVSFLNLDSSDNEKEAVLSGVKLVKGAGIKL
jgi:hypothetical protein